MTTLSQQIVLIGPTCADKTTLGGLVGALLGLPFIDLDEVAEPYYAEVGFGQDTVSAIRPTLGDLGTYRWWQQGHPHAVRRVLAEYPAHVIALGAGHSSYADVDLFAQVQASLQDVRVILVLPSPTPETSLSVLRDRNIAERNWDWVMDGRDVLAEWVNSQQNIQLAATTVYTQGRTPDESARHMVALLKSHDGTE
jgi:shikimate kinase